MVIRKKNESWSGQFTARRSNGQDYEEAVTIASVLDGKGEVNCFVGVCRDISEKLLRDQRLLQLQKFEIVSKMAGGFAHDLENFKKRLKALELKVANDGIILSDAQVAAPEKKKHDDEACGGDCKLNCVSAYH